MPLFINRGIKPSFFRLTNVSSNLVYLRKGEKYAMLMFEQLENAPEHPYQGAFRQRVFLSGAWQIILPNMQTRSNHWMAKSTT